MWLLFSFLLAIVLGKQTPPSLDEMKQITLLSYAAACRVNLTDWNCYWCTQPETPRVKVNIVFENDGFQGSYGYIGTTSSEIIVSFRGSSSVSNWLHDLDFKQVPYPISGALVHEGFYHAYNDVRDQVESHVQALLAKNPNMPVRVMGHSLGAALAVICSSELVRLNITQTGQISTLTIGQPRVGNKVFAQNFDSVIGRHYRIVNKEDIVPHLPPIRVDYYHTGTEIWFPTNFTSYKVCDGSGEDPTCSDSLSNYSVDDHLWYLGIFAHKAEPYQCGGFVPHK